MTTVRWNRLRPRLSITALAAVVVSGAAATLATGRATEGGQNRAGPPISALVENPAESEAPRTEDEANEWARDQLLSGLVGGKHDFSEGGKSGRDLCLPCHTPHLATPPLPRLDRRPATTQPLRPYEGPGIELSGWSLLCLGCHDGVTAKDVYASAHAVALSGQLANSHLGVAGLRGHPVGVRYPTTSEKYEPIAAVEAAGLMLPGGRLQCTSCHDAHNTRRLRGMLRISNERSRLCLTCHRI